MVPAHTPAVKIATQAINKLPCSSSPLLAGKDPRPISKIAYLNYDSSYIELETPILYSELHVAEICFPPIVSDNEVWGDSRQAPQDGEQSWEIDFEWKTRVQLVNYGAYPLSIKVLQI